jgi:hypothetical protein
MTSVDAFDPLRADQTKNLFFRVALYNFGIVPARNNICRSRGAASTAVSKG